MASDDRSPETISSVTTWPNVAGSTAVTNVVPVPIFTCPWRIADTAPIAGSAARSIATCGLNGEKFGVLTMKSAVSVRSSVAFAEAFSDAPDTATNDTRPRPIMSAADVEAVRRGLRIAFCRPRRPGSAPRRNGRPITAASGRANSGDSTAMPTNVSAAPAPTRIPRLPVEPNSPRPSSTTASAVSAPPVIDRRRSDDVGGAFGLAERLDRRHPRGTPRPGPPTR